MKKIQNTTGYSLIEVLVSIAVLLIAILGPMTIASQGIKSAAYTLEQNTAFFLAQEGMEAMFALRSDAALEEYESIDLSTGDGTESSWDWILTVLEGPGPCDFSVFGASCSFGLDFKDDTLADNFNSSSAQCTGGNVSSCRLFKDMSNSRSVYQHNGSSGQESLFTRIITVTEVQADVIDVTVRVTWNSHVFGGSEQSVEVTSEIHDITPVLP